MGVTVGRNKTKHNKGKQNKRNKRKQNKTNQTKLTNQTKNRRGFGTCNQRGTVVNYEVTYDRLVGRTTLNISNRVARLNTITMQKPFNVNSKTCQRDLNLT